MLYYEPGRWPQSSGRLGKGWSTTLGPLSIPLVPLGPPMPGKASVGQGGWGLLLELVGGV